jgi:hypothetical protein
VDDKWWTGHVARMKLRNFVEDLQKACEIIDGGKYQLI